LIKNAVDDKVLVLRQKQKYSDMAIYGGVKRFAKVKAKLLALGVLSVLVGGVEASFLTKAEMESEASAVTSWLAKPDYTEYGTIDWTREQKRANYTIERSVSGYACVVYSEMYESSIEMFFDQVPKNDTFSSSCRNVTVKSFDINCDPLARSIGSCKGGKPNMKLKEIRFDGKSSCNDVSAAVDIKYGTKGGELEEFCSNGGVRRRLAAPAEILATCPVGSAQYPFGYMFVGTAVKRAPNDGEDKILQHHLHYVQDNVSTSYWYRYRSTYRAMWFHRRCFY
jgi:hypothetical protein